MEVAYTPAVLSGFFQRALAELSERLESQDLRWAVVGSTSLALQGMDVQPRDIDIVVRREDLESVRQRFASEYPSSVRTVTHAAGEPTHEFTVMLDGVPVQIMAESASGPYVAKLLAGRTVPIRLQDETVPCLALDAEAEAYNETGRPKKAKRIRDFQRSR